MRQKLFNSELILINSVPLGAILSSRQWHLCQKELKARYNKNRLMATYKMFHTYKLLVVIGEAINVPLTEKLTVLKIVPKIVPTGKSITHKSSLIALKLSFYHVN